MESEDQPIEPLLLEPLLQHNFPQLPPESVQRLKQLEAAIQEWNTRINVISRKDAVHLAERHILHALAIYARYPLLPGTNVADVGAGGGFPGLPLAAVMPEVQFTLIDSIRKKTEVMKAAAEAAGLDNVQVLWSRSEDVNQKFDFVTGRAVTALDGFIAMTRHLLHCRSSHPWANGILYLKGLPDAEDQKIFDRWKGPLRVHPLKELYSEPFFDTKVLVYLPCC